MTDNDNSKNNDKSSSSSLYCFLHQLPKVELHAHLNGCIRPDTLFALAEEKGVTLSSHHFQRSPTSSTQHSENSNNDALLYNVMPRSLQDCFDMFAEIPKCVNDVASLKRITREALDDFAAHHVVYLELRTTPKALNEACDKRLYVQTVLSVMQEFEIQQQKQQRQREGEMTIPMTCRLIIAIDRSLSIEEACENVDLAISLYKKGKESDGDLYTKRIVGMDLGGNPTRGDFSTFRPHLERARRAGLRITLHCGEVASSCNHDDGEAKAMIEFCPDRLGHALFVPNTLLLQKRIPVETCPTSNVMTLELAQYAQGHLIQGLKQHPQLKEWLDTKYPLAIGTDDPGVFDTSPTKELWLLCRAFDINHSDLCRLVERSMEYAFCDERTKRRIEKCIQERMGMLSMQTISITIEK